MTLLERKILPGTLIAFAVSISIYFYLKQYRLATDTAVKSLSYFATTDSSSQQMIAAFHRGAFQPVTYTVFNGGIADRYYWFHFQSQSKEGADIPLLDIDNSRLNEIELFIQENNRLRSLGKLGDNYPFYQREIKNKNFLYQLPESATDYFLFVNQVGSTFTLPMSILSEDAFFLTDDRYLFLSGWVYGILVFVALMSFLYFMTSGHKLYFYYCAYIITAVFWFFSYFGLGYAFLWGNYPGINIVMAPITASLNIMLNLQICQSLLKLADQNPLLNHLFNFCKGSLLATAIFPVVFHLHRFGYVVNHFYLTLFLLTILASMALVSWAVIFDLLKNSLVAKFYFAASILKALSIVNLALIEFGFLQTMINMEGILQVGILVEILLLTYALARRYTNYKLKTFSKVIEAHEKERAFISREIHDSISNSLTGIHYGIEDVLADEKTLSTGSVERLQRISNSLSKLHSEARNISHNVMPEYIDKRCISDTISHYIEELRSGTSTSNLSVIFHSHQTDHAFTKEVKLNIFRIVQEILSNIIKHSHATQASITFNFLKNKLLIVAEDNGVGMNSNWKEKKGMGIANMKSRVELLQGTLLVSATHDLIPVEVSTSSGTALPGSRIEIKIPYRSTVLHKTNSHAY